MYRVCLPGGRSRRAAPRLRDKCTAASAALLARPEQTLCTGLRIEPGIAYDRIKLKLGFEVLEGDGTTAFQTPLATLHAFQGWADQFLVTPGAGVDDAWDGGEFGTREARLEPRDPLMRRVAAGFPSGWNPRVFCGIAADA